MAVFRAFKPEAMNKIAQSMGFSGNMREFESFIEQDPARQARMKQFTNAAMQMAKGGSAFGMLSVKAGIDNNPKPTQADRIAGATKKR